MARWDLVVAGGGLGGATLAKVMCERGARVLVVEPETAFKDRVRGESIMSWGVAEATTLGVLDAILAAGGRELPYWDMRFGPQRMRRDVPATNPHKTPVVGFCHPRMQEGILELARRAGAEVRRGARVKSVTAGATPRATIVEGGRSEEVSARLVVGADGRTSSVRSYGNFRVNRDRERLLVAGVLLEGVDVPMDASTIVQGFGVEVLFFPQGGDRVRSYVAYHRDVRSQRLSGAGAFGELVQMAQSVGTPEEWLEGARVVGPLATFDGADAWIDHPHREGIVLVGDAAASSDPTWGQGLSLTLRDVRVLTDRLKATDDWRSAADAYAREHDRHYATLHTFEDWMTTLFMEVGDEADARRAIALPKMAMDPTRVPGILFAGPDVALDEAARALFFGEA